MCHILFNCTSNYNNRKMTVQWIKKRREKEKEYACVRERANEQMREYGLRIMRVVVWRWN